MASVGRPRGFISDPPIGSGWDRGEGGWSLQFAATHTALAERMTRTEAAIA